MIPMGPHGLSMSEHNKLAVCPHASSTWKLNLEMMACSIFGHLPGWRRVAAGFFVRVRFLAVFYSRWYNLSCTVTLRI